MPPPIAVIMLPISALANILLACAFSTFKILPRSGKIACVSRFLPFLALPPAELPSTMNNSHSSGFLLEQSASLPGRVVNSREPFLRKSSRALRAAIRAFAAMTIFSIIILAKRGSSSKNLWNCSLTIPLTIFLTSELPNLVFVCPSNCGFGCLTEITAVKPSAISS